LNIPRLADVVTNMFNDTRIISSATTTPDVGEQCAANPLQDEIKQCMNVLWISGRREKRIRVNSVGATENIGKFELEVPIVKHLVGHLDRQSRIRTYQRIWHFHYDIFTWGHLESFAQHPVLPLHEDNPSILTSDEKCEDI
jgi:hypothetical protein